MNDKETFTCSNCNTVFPAYKTRTWIMPVKRFSCKVKYTSYCPKCGRMIEYIAK